MAVMPCNHCFRLVHAKFLLMHKGVYNIVPKEAHLKVTGGL